MCYVLYSTLISDYNNIIKANQMEGTFHRKQRGGCLENQQNVLLRQTAPCIF